MNDILIAKLRRDNTKITSVVMDGFPDAQMVWLISGVQQFCVTPHGCEDAEQAKYTQSMLAKALAKIVVGAG